MISSARRCSRWRNFVIEALRAIVANGTSRQERASLVVETIRRAGNYRWVGLYDVAGEDIAALAWTGSTPPAHPRFPKNAGINGRAVRDRATVIVHDVLADPDYLTTFSTTRSE